MIDQIDDNMLSKLNALELMLIDFFDLQNGRLGEIMTTMNDVQTKATAMEANISGTKDRLTGIGGKLDALKTSVDSAVSDLKNANDVANVAQLDQIMTIMAAIETQASEMATGAQAMSDKVTSLEQELTAAITAATPAPPMPVTAAPVA